MPTQAAVQIQKHFQASPERVFAAWTEPEQLTRWWRCDPNWATPLAEVDLRVGGRYRLGMHNPDKNEQYICTGEFLEVDPPARLSYTWNWEEGGMDVAGSVVTVRFDPADDGGTDLTLEHTNFPSSEAAGEHNQGWEGALAVLVQLLRE